jgi:hypothetical protein
MIVFINKKLKPLFTLLHGKLLVPIIVLVTTCGTHNNAQNFFPPHQPCGFHIIMMHHAYYLNVSNCFINCQNVLLRRNVTHIMCYHHDHLTPVVVGFHVCQLCPLL